MLRDRLRVSARRGCRIACQHRSTLRREPLPMTRRARKAARDLGGAAAVGVSPRASPAPLGGLEVNRKRVQRLWREESPRVPQRRHKPRRLGESTVPAERLRAQRPGQVRALDFQFDQTADGRVLKLLNVVDEYTREALEMLVERRIDADAPSRCWSESPRSVALRSTSGATTASS
jgi:putative transposase